MSIIEFCLEKSTLEMALDEMRYHMVPHKRRKGPPYVALVSRDIKDVVTVEQKLSPYENAKRREIGFPENKKSFVRTKQKCFPINDLRKVLESVWESPNFRLTHFYISQNHFYEPNRRAVSLWSFGGVWVDIDLKSPDWDKKTIASYVYKLLEDLDFLLIPMPSAIIWSGRGLHVKWIFDEPLPAPALPRWSALIKYINERLASIDWPVDKQAMDVSRVLRIVGTVNPVSGFGAKIEERPVLLVYQGVLYSFDWLADEVLPYSRSELESKVSKEVWQEWDKNRCKASDFVRRVKTSAEAANAEVVQTLWWRRLQAIINIAVARGGIQEGQRNAWVWIAANALAWGVNGVARFEAELPAVVQKIAPSFTPSEVRSSVSSVLKRLRNGERLYAMKTETIVKMLGLTPAEAEQLDVSLGHVTHNPGIMGLPPIEGLPYHEWVKEVKRRFSLGAGYTHEQRRLQTAEKRLRAVFLRNQGVSLRAIAQELCVSHEAVRKWLAE